MGYGVAMRTRSYTHMSPEERETLSLGLARGHSLRTMARLLVRAPSTLSREYARTTTRGSTLSSLHGADAGGSSVLSAAAIAHTPRPLAVAICPDTSDPRAARPNRLPDASNARVLTTWVNSFRPDHLCGAGCAAPRHPAERTADRTASGARGASASGAGGGSTGPDPQYDADCRAPR
jgi:hypothetical protein